MGKVVIVYDHGRHEALRLSNALQVLGVASLCYHVGDFSLLDVEALLGAASMGVVVWSPTDSPVPLQVFVAIAVQRGVPLTPIAVSTVGIELQLEWRWQNTNLPEVLRLYVGLSGELSATSAPFAAERIKRAIQHQTGG